MNGNNSTGGNGIDWDGELQTLMESSGIDPAQMKRTPWFIRLRRKVFGAKAAVAAVGLVVPLGWVVIESGAPVVAVVPVLAWFAGWIALGVYVSAGRPDWTITADTLGDIAVAVWHSGSRFAYARTRPARARWRAWRAAKALDAQAESGQVTA